MSSSNADREMLLSAALDGELSAQEQSEFDRLIAHDPMFAAEFEELKTLRNDLRLCFAELRNQSLPVGATKRMVTAAIAAADQLRTTADAVTPVRATASSADDSRLAGAAKSKWIFSALALAASIVFAVGYWNHERTQVNGTPNLIAQVESEVPSSPLVQTGSPQDTLPESAVAPADRVPMVNNAESIATIAPVDIKPGDAFPGETGARPKVMGITPAPNRSIEAEDLAAVGNAPTVDKPGRSQTPDPSMVVDPVKPEVQRQPLEVVLVLSVKLTQSGRDELALQKALLAADIRLDKDSLMGANVVSHLQTAKVIDASVGIAGQSSSKLYFIEASAKRIDRLFSHLMSESRSFESVGLGLATEPPLLAAVGDLREIDATKIRQNEPVGLARDLVTDDGRSISVDPAYPLVPLNGEVVGSVFFQSTTNTGDDEPAQLLLFVK